MYFIWCPLFFIAILSWSTLAHAELARPCSPSVCKLPDCFCSGTRVPKNLPAENVPQFVMLTFDDSLNPNVGEFYHKIFNQGRKNPNGCPIRGTFYVTHEWNDYWMTKKLYSEGHEIADHSITHETTDAFKNADLDRWVKEIGGMKKILEIFGQVRSKDVRGFRAPYLQPGGDLMFKAMKMSGLEYDTSLPSSENNPPMWPYTLDYKSTQECKIGPCPVESHPGMWEVPMVYYNDVDGNVCAMVDACHDNGTMESASEMLLKNFLRHYLTNRAPFPMFMHAGWFTAKPYRFMALIDFIDTILQLHDVYFVPVSDVIDWIKDPAPCETSLDKNGVPQCPMKAKKDWGCRSRNVRTRGVACPAKGSKTCVLKKIVGWRGDQPVRRSRRFNTCLSCPDTYPWLGNPDGDMLRTKMGMKLRAEDRKYWSPNKGGVRLSTPKKKEKPKRVFNSKNAYRKLMKFMKAQVDSDSVDPNILARALGNDMQKQMHKEMKNENSHVQRPVTGGL